MNVTAARHFHPTLNLLFRLALLVSVFLSIRMHAEEETKRFHFLILHSYAQDYLWAREMHDGITDVLRKEDVPPHYRIEYMDTKNYFSEDYLMQLRDMYRDKYAGVAFDGIIASDNNALHFLQVHGEELFPGVPVVVGGVNGLYSIPGGLKNTYVVVEEGCHKETLTAALKQQPDTRVIYAISDQTTTGQALQKEVRILSNRWNISVPIEFVSDLTFPELETFVSSRKPDEMIYLLPYFKDAAGQVFKAEEAAKRIANVASVPVYVSWNFQMDTGVIGGCLISSYGHGERAASSMLRLVKGKAVPYVDTQTDLLNQLTFDYEVLQKFGISVNRLDSNSRLINEPINYYERHKEIIEIGAILIFALILVILLLIRNLNSQKIINLKNKDILELKNEMIETQRELLSTLGGVIETRSQETAFHVRRVARYSRMIGEKYGLSRKKLDLLEMASPMHDVGKIGIPESILHKPGALTEEEFDEIKKHTEIGFDILNISNRELLRTARIIAYQHHERWDGSGYPLQNAGTKIHIFARITTLCDIYDALSNERVYKPAWPEEEVMAYIRENRGSIFDPKLVDIFFDNYSEILRIKHCFQRCEETGVCDGDVCGEKPKNAWSFSPPG